MGRVTESDREWKSRDNMKKELQEVGEYAICGANVELMGSTRIRVSLMFEGLRLGVKCYKAGLG